MNDDMSKALITSLQTDAEMLVHACLQAKEGWDPAVSLIFLLVRRMAEAVIPQDLKGQP